MTASTIRRVLILDDEEGYRESLKRRFENSVDFRFDVTTVASLDDCIDRKLDEDQFDIVVIDLSLVGRPDDDCGLLILNSNQLWKTEHRIAYTAYATLEKAVRAMQLGATDFVSKLECSVQDLVKHVEAAIIRRQRRAEDQEVIRQFLLQNLDEFRREKPGMALAIAVNQTTARPEVVAEGASKLAVLMQYNQKQREALDTFPLDPYLHLVPAGPTGSGGA